MKHTVCPQEWRETEIVTGDYDFDASLARSSNAEMKKRLSLYTLSDNAYGIRTGYNGYHGYSGDD